MSYPRYPTYKDSGVLWLGRVPAHWNVRRLKSLLARNDSGVWGELDDAGVIVLRSTEQTVGGGWRIEDPAKVKLNEEDRQSALLRAGDLVITKSSGSEAHIGKTSLVTPSIEALGCAFSNFMQRLRVSAGIEPALVHHILNCPIGREQLVTGSSTTTGLANLNGRIIGSVYVALPPTEEQQAILAFLKRETEQIDALVRNLQKLVSLLQEKRQALISHVVIKGLNQNVAMKHSGVEWLGEIPAHWDVVKSRRLFALRKGTALPSDQQLTAAQKYGVIYQEDFVEREGRRVVQVIKGGDILKHVEPNDFVISMRSFQGGIEGCKYRGSISSAYVVLIPSELVDFDYFTYLFKSQQYIQALQSTTNLVRDGQALRYNNFTLVDLPLAPLDEQRQIASFLCEETRKIDVLIEKSSSSIDLLQERRSALITAAVTGQIDVRGSTN